jgi:hypothetical protein
MPRTLTIANAVNIRLMLGMYKASNFTAVQRYNSRSYSMAARLAMRR